MNLDQLESMLRTAYTKRLFWVMGSPMARGHAVAALLAEVPRTHRITFDLRVHAPETILEALATRPAVNGRVLFLVRSAHLWGDNSAPLKAWLGHGRDDLLVMESGLREWKPEDWSRHYSDEYLWQMKTLVHSSKAVLVNCEFAKSKAGIDKLLGLFYRKAKTEVWETKVGVQAASGSTGLSIALARRLENFPAKPEALVRALAPSPLPEDVVECLLRGDKAAAMEAKYDASAFTRLTYSIDMVSMIARNRRGFESAFEMSHRLGIHQMQVSRHMDLLKHFDAVSTERRMNAVAMASELWGAAIGQAEQRAAIVLLISLW